MSNIIVLCGHTASGKTTIANLLRNRLGNCIKTTSYTTRAKREDETNDKDYHFITRQEFEDMIEAGKFFEWTEYKGNYYGTSLKEIINAVDNDKNIIMVLDTKGAIDIENKCNIATVIYLKRPYRDTVKSIEGRVCEPEEKQKRLLELEEEMKESRFFKNNIYNTDIRQTMDEIFKIIQC